MDDQIFDPLARRGLKVATDSVSVHNWDSKQVRALHESLWNTIYHLQYASEPNDDPRLFRFVAGASLRGDICLGCRSKKLGFLSRFATLYSDLVILPLPLESPARVGSVAEARIELQQTAESLLYLKPLIKSRIVRPVVMTTRHCARHGAATKELIELASTVADDLAEEHLRKFTIYYEPNIGLDRPPALYIQGPTDYLEHGEIVISYPEPPNWVAKTWRPGSDGRIPIPLAKARRTGWVHRIFHRIAQDTTFHLAYGTMWQAKFLTDLPGETELLRDLENEDVAVQNQTAALFTAMTHSLPFIESLPVSVMLKLRSELAESFEQYRWAIASIVREYGRDQSLTVRRANQICADVLSPKIAALENRIALERKRFTGKVIATSGVVSVLVALGAFGLLTQAQALALLGGAATMRLADQLGESRSPSLESATHDLYFLLRLKQKKSTMRRARFGRTPDASNVR